MNLARLKLTGMIISCLIVFLLFFTPDAYALYGTGAEGNPYILSDAADLSIMPHHLSSHFILGADIDASTVTLIPVGNELDGAFTGTFDGKGHTISNLTMNLPNNKYVGVFGYLEGSVTNLKLSNVNLTGGRYVGGIAGHAGLGSSITDCEVVSGSIESGDTVMNSNAGGIVGVCEGALTNCRNGATVSATNKAAFSYAGGIVGYQMIENADYIGFVNSGSVQTLHGNAGGIIGYSSVAVSLADCINSGNVTNKSYSMNDSSNPSAGGMIGLTPKSAILRNCHNSGMIGLSLYAEVSGGMIGKALCPIDLIECSNSGMFCGTYKGGMVGLLFSGATLTGCVNTGNAADGGRFSGGMIGYASTDKLVTLKQCRNSGDLFSTWWDDIPMAGGMIGNALCPIELFGCSNTGILSVKCTGSNRGYAGGMVGYIGGASTIVGCSNSGLFMGPTENYIGGMVANFGHQSLVLEECCSIGESFAGLIGYSRYSSTINNCLQICTAPTNSISIFGKRTLVCSGLRMRSYNRETCFSLDELKNTEGAAYADWNLSKNWIANADLNSGLPMPKNCVGNMDVLNESVLILAPGESDVLSASFSTERWETTQEAVVSCENGVITARSPGTACISAISSDGLHRANCIVFVYEMRNFVSLSKNTAGIDYNRSLALTTDLTADDPQGIIWSSSNDDIATVDQLGNVVGKRAGTATITVYLPLSDVSATCEVTVTGSALTSIALTDAAVNTGETTTISKTISPNNSSYFNQIDWTSSNESVATVDQNGTVTGIRTGTVVITATAGSAVGTCIVTVKQAADGVTLDLTELTLELGLSAQLTATAYPSDQTDMLTWSTGNSSIATVRDGIVTAMGKGQVLITVRTTSGKSATCMVTVIDPIVMPRSVTLDHTVLRPIVGERIQLQAQVLPVDTTDPSISWESTNTEVATVSASGVVEAIAPGSAVISATSVNGFYDLCQVRVGVVSSAAFVISEGRGVVNRTFETAVHLLKNPGIASFTLAVNYDADAITPLSVTTGELYVDGSIMSNIGADTSDGKLRITGYSASDITDDGTLFVITWQNGNKPGTFPISLDYNAEDICNAEKVEVSVSSEESQVLILNYPVGDIYQDNTVNMKDVVYLARYFNGQETLSPDQELSSDLFFDHNIDIKDLTALVQLLSETLSQNNTDGAAMRQFSSTPRLMTADGADPFKIQIVDAELRKDFVALKAFGTNCPGVAAIRFRINVPDGFQVVSVQPCDLLANGNFSFNEQSDIVTWYSADNEQLNGELFTAILQRIGDAVMPTRLELDYSAADFFSADDYRDVPIITELGIITLEQYISIEGMTAGGSELTVTLDMNWEDEALLIAAFYREGQMCGTAIQNISADQRSYIIQLPDGSGFECKVFLVDSDSCRPLDISSNISIR